MTRKRTLSLVLSGVLLLGASVPAIAAAPPAEHTRGPQLIPLAKPLEKAPAFWEQMKADLNADPNLTRTETSANGTRTLTYTSSDGFALVLSEPAEKRSTGGITPQFSVGGCGWFNVCIYLNRTDQGALAAGAAAFLAVAICVIPAVGWIGCAAVAAALAIAQHYIATNGFCRRTLQIGLLPPGRDLKCI